MKNILVVDDDTEIRKNICEILGTSYSVAEAATGAEALAAMKAAEPDIVLLDLMLPDMTGLEVLIRVKEMSPRVKIVMITAFATISNAVESIKHGASDYIAKPFKIDVLMTTIRRVIEEAKFEEDIKRLDMDFTLSSLSNPIRRNILIHLDRNVRMRLMEICRTLDIDDHTKVVFHLKNLKENGLIHQNPDKSYSLTGEGRRTLVCFKTFSKNIASQDTAASL